MKDKKQINWTIKYDEAQEELSAKNGEQRNHHGEGWTMTTCILSRRRADHNAKKFATT